MKLVWILDSVALWIKWLNIHPKRWTQWTSKKVCYRRNHRNIHNTIFDNRKMRLNEISQTFRSWTFEYAKVFYKVNLARGYKGDNSLCLKSMIRLKHGIDLVFNDLLLFSNLNTMWAGKKRSESEEAIAETNFEAKYKNDIEKCYRTFGR